MMSNLASRLSQLTTIFNDILGRAGGVGMSVGILHQGQIISTSHYGHCSLADQRAPDGDTQYYIASLTKAVTAIGAAMLVEKGVLDWERPLVDYLPDFSSRHDDVGSNANLIDFLSHRTGLTGANALWVQRHQEFMMPKNEIVNTAAHIKAIHPFRSKFLYNNWGYGLATEVIERVTGQSYGMFVKENIFDPLGLHNTTVRHPNNANVVGAHMVRNDGSACPIKPPPNSDFTGLAGAGGGKSTLNDLLQLYKTMLLRYESENERNADQSVTDGHPLPKLAPLLDGKIGIGDSDVSKNAYALGWVRSVLPERLGTIGINTMLIGPENMPLIGISSPGTVIYHHHGNLVGATSSIHLMPSTNTAIVVLCNTLGLADATDWIGQLVLQTILGEEPHDYIELSDKAKDAGIRQFEDVKSELVRGKTGKPYSKGIEAYCGRYLNTAKNFELEISAGANGTILKMRAQHFDDVVYTLMPYDGDTFYWRCDRDTEVCDEMMFPWPWTGLHLVTFTVDKNGVVSNLAWQHDPLTGAEEFHRCNESQAPNGWSIQKPMINSFKM